MSIAVLAIASSPYRFAYALFSSAYGIAAGLFGSLLASMWAFSDHIVAHHNENLWLANPLHFLAGLLSLGLLFNAQRLDPVLRWLWRALGLSTLLLLVAKLFVPALDQDIDWSAALLAPINLGLAIASQRRHAHPSHGSEPGSAARQRRADADPAG
jgi:peptidoglycan/LPS O-acetylase OafA/YrhL